MILLPAIDLSGGCAVRLVQGDYNRKTVYSEDPPQLAKGFEEAGAKWLHLVDLDGAKRGERINLPVVKRIVESVSLQVELGGGVRDMAALEGYLSLGVKRVILGTAAVEDRAFLQAALGRYGAAVAVGMDLRAGKIAIRGWLEESAETMDAFCARLADMGVQTVVCTDVSRDGMLGGTNVALYEALCARFAGIDFIASGGVSSLEDIRALRAMGLYGAIAGKALYTGALDLKEALAAAAGEEGNG